MDLTEAPLGEVDVEDTSVAAVLPLDGGGGLPAFDVDGDFPEATTVAHVDDGHDGTRHGGEVALDLAVVGLLLAGVGDPIIASL